jgi:hypothetical protein
MMSASVPRPQFVPPLGIRPTLTAPGGDFGGSTDRERGNQRQFDARRSMALLKKSKAALRLPGAASVVPPVFRSARSSQPSRGSKYTQDQRASPRLAVLHEESVLRHLVLIGTPGSRQRTDNRRSRGHLQWVRTQKTSRGGDTERPPLPCSTGSQSSSSTARRH